MELRFRDIGEFFKNARTAAGVSQAELSKILGFKSSQIVSNWERGLCAPPLKSVSKMIEVFELEASEVIDVITQANRRYLVRQLMESGDQSSANTVQNSATCL